MQTADELFAHIRAFFNQPHNHYTEQETRRAWQVLTALRGPDDGDAILKDHTTAVIRRELLGAIYPEQAGGAIIVDDNPDAVQYRTGTPYDRFDTHFGNHVKAAFRALGLTWDAKNDHAR